MHTYELDTQNTLKMCHHEMGAWVRTIGAYRKVLALIESDFEVYSTIH